MIDTNAFLACLRANELDFFTGVPDSLLQDFCACVQENARGRTVTAANEGNAVGIAAGYHLATGRAAVVYMQNSGIGNAVNPLLSLADEAVYGIPMLLLIGWRGEPGVPDEPQHKKQGVLTPALLETMGIRTEILSDDYREQVRACARYMKEQSRPCALIVKKGTFSRCPYPDAAKPFPLTREQALTLITEQIGERDIVVTTTGKTSRELYELRARTGAGHGHDFLTVGSMGHSSSIALGLSLFTDRCVWCIDGDGAFLMHMGAAAVNAAHMGDNYRCIIINNGAHESVGGQATVGFRIDMAAILRGCGFAHVHIAKTEAEIAEGMAALRMQPKSALVIYVQQGSRKDLGRPQTTPAENKQMLMETIRNESTDL